MYLPLLLGVAAFAIAVLLSTRIVGGARARLSGADRARLADVLGAARSPSRSAIGVFGYLSIVCLWLAALLVVPEHARTVHLAFLVAVFGVLVALVVRSHRRTAPLPRDFRRSMLYASVLRVAGVAAMLGAVAWPLVWRA